MIAPRRCAVAALVLTPFVFATTTMGQQPPPAPSPAPPLMTAPRPDDRATTPAAPPALDPLSAQPSQATLPPVTVADARRLIGRTVITQDGKAQTVIRDITVQGDTVTGLVLTGADGKTATVPPTALRVGNDGSLTLAISAEALAWQQAPRRWDSNKRRGADGRGKNSRKRNQKLTKPSYGALLA